MRGTQPSATERQAMLRAVDLAADPTVRPGANPRVGCVLLDASGTVLAEGHHRGAGTPHAEVAALAALPAGVTAHTAVVTLEPCNHTGRTGPCTQALIAAGVRRVVVGALDPNPVAAGGVDVLRAAGIEVVTGVELDAATALDRAWHEATRLGRPHVTLKFACSLDGRVAAADGTSRWISSAESRRHAHGLRAGADAVVVGTGTVRADDPRLTVRDDAGADLPRELQPLRVVLGTSEIPHGAAILDGSAAPTLHLATHDPHQACESLWDNGIRRMLVEGGPTVAGSFLAAGVVDTLVVYQAPVLLGAGPAAVNDAGVGTMADALKIDVEQRLELGADVVTIGRIAATETEE